MHFLALAVEVDDAALPVARQRLAELASALDLERQRTVLVGPAPLEGTIARAFASVTDAGRRVSERADYLASLNCGDIVFWTDDDGQLRCGRLVAGENFGEMVTLHADGERIDVMTERVVPLPVLDPLYGPV